MAEVPYEEVDYLEVARNEVTEQFKQRDIFDRYLQLLIEQQEEIQQVFKDLLQKRSIDEATGAQLDIIGEIVGQPRELIDTALVPYFAYLGYPNAQSFGDLDNSSLGGYYYSLGDPLAGSTLLNDEQYRMFIKAKILKNTTRATPDDVLNFIRFVFNSETNNVIAEGNAEFTVMVGKELSLFEQVLLTYVGYSNGYPSRFLLKPVGVRVNVGTFDSEDYFAFLGAPNAKGYGDLADLSVGGKYGQLL